MERKLGQRHHVVLTGRCTGHECLTTGLAKPIGCILDVGRHLRYEAVLRPTEGHLLESLTLMRVVCIDFLIVTCRW